MHCRHQYQYQLSFLRKRSKVKLTSLISEPSPKQLDATRILSITYESVKNFDFLKIARTAQVTWIMMISIC